MPAPKGNKFAQGNRGGGRPSLYKPQYAEIARKMCERGATNADLAMRFGVALSTVSQWTFEHPEFSEALHSAKDKFDNQVERSLAQRAIGYEYIAQKVFVYHGKAQVVDFRQHVPGDTNAQKMWLTARKRAEWLNGHVDGEEENPILSLYKKLIGSSIRPRDDADEEAQAEAVDGAGEAACEAPADEIASSEVEDEQVRPFNSLDSSSNS